MALVLDTGALIAFERGDRAVAAFIEAARRRRDRVVTSSGCVAQAWRDGTRQALLARLLAGTAEHPLDPGNSRPIGQLCSRSGIADVVDSHVAFLARNEDAVLTSDPGELRTLLSAAGSAASVIPC